MTPLISLQPREHLYRHGSEQLTAVQAVTLILGSGTRKSPVAKLSSCVVELLEQGVRTVPELSELPGVGPAKASALVAALALGDLLEKPRLSEVLIGPEAVYESCHDLLEEPQEHLVAFFLSVRNRRIRRELVTIGTASASVVHAREVFRAAILSNAHSIILAHNHPSGDPSPSSADCVVTERMAKAGWELGIELLDHVICARSGWVSFKEYMPSLFP